MTMLCRVTATLVVLALQAVAKPSCAARRHFHAVEQPHRGPAVSQQGCTSAIVVVPRAPVASVVSISISCRPAARSWRVQPDHMLANCRPPPMPHTRVCPGLSAAEHDARHWKVKQLCVSQPRPGYPSVLDAARSQPHIRRRTRSRLRALLDDDSAAAACECTPRHARTGSTHDAQSDLCAQLRLRSASQHCDWLDADGNEPESPLTRLANCRV